MQEFWFCAGCKSMNRADVTRCYKCRAPKAQATMAITRERAPGAVLTPGLDEDHRRIAWTLMQSHRYISAWRLGYIAAGLTFITIALFAMALTIEVGALLSLAIKSTRSGQVSLDPRIVDVFLVVGLAAFVSMIATIAVHSVFLCLTSMNCPALGAGTPRFGPIRSALWWIEIYLWRLWGAMLLSPGFYLLVAVLYLEFVQIPGRVTGLAGLVIWVSLTILWIAILRWAYGALGGPITAIGKPKRLLQDLNDRLGVPTSHDSRLVSLWSAAWGTTCGIAYAIILSPFLLLLFLAIVFLATSLTETSLSPASPEQAGLSAVALVLLVLAADLIAEGFALFTLGRITVEMSQRQRVRERWILSGLDPDGSPAPTPRGPVTSAGPVAPQQPPEPMPGPNRPMLPMQSPRPMAPDQTTLTMPLEQTPPQMWQPRQTPPEPAGRSADEPPHSGPAGDANVGSLPAGSAGSEARARSIEPALVAARPRLAARASGTAGARGAARAQA